MTSVTIVYNGRGERIESLPAGRKCVILNSRQSKRPCRRDAWVVATDRAVDYAVQQGFTLVSSIGLNTWELVVHLTNIRQGRQVIILPVCGGEDIQQSISEIVTDFRLEPTACLFIMSSSNNISANKRKNSWPERDLLSLELADVILPLSIRPGGNLEHLLEQCPSSTKEIREEFRIGYRQSVDRVHYSLTVETMNPELRALEESHIIHWTRSSHTPFPEESRFEYYQDILRSETYPRSAFHTLSRIICEGVIRSSNRFIRGGERVVSLSSLPPNEAIGLMRWRRRYVYYSLEPYGVAIRRDLALAAGLRPVFYGDDSLYKTLEENDRPFFQNRGAQDVDWLSEAEWRHVGDLDLRQFPADGVHFITYQVAETEALLSLTDRTVLPLVTS